MMTLLLSACVKSDVQYLIKEELKLVCIKNETYTQAEKTVLATIFEKSIERKTPEQRIITRIIADHLRMQSANAECEKQGRILKEDQ